VRYDQKKIEAMLDSTLKELGPQRFSSMKVTELERHLRAAAPDEPLPARTQLRAAIHAFRTTRWPHAAPRRRGLQQGSTPATDEA
jgi:hypothetical protein